VFAELAFEHAVIMFDLLLLAEVLAVVSELSATPHVHAGRVLTALDRALRRIAARALEEKLQAIAAAKATNWTCITCHWERSEVRGRRSGIFFWWRTGPVQSSI